MNRLRTIALLLAVLGASILGSGVTAMVSAHGGDASMIHACLNPGNGTIYVVGANQACGPNQTALDWNIQGSAGPAGPVGPAGPIGPTGVANITIRPDTLLNQVVGDFRISTAFCLPGEKLTGGGATSTPNYAIINTGLVESYPSATLINGNGDTVSGWIATVHRDVAPVTAYALCAAP
jgi:hypothetical protein